MKQLSKLQKIIRVFCMIYVILGLILLVFIQRVGVQEEVQEIGMRLVQLYSVGSVIFAVGFGLLQRKKAGSIPAKLVQLFEIIWVSAGVVLCVLVVAGIPRLLGICAIYGVCSFLLGVFIYIFGKI